MPWHTGKPADDDFLSVSVQYIRENFAELEPLQPHVAELVDLTALHPYIAALLDSRIVDHNLDVPNPPNGYYVRWENGLQVVFGEATLGSISLSASGSVYASPDLTVTLPAVFSTGVYAWHVNSDAGMALTWAGLGTLAQSDSESITFRLYGGSALSNPNARVSFFAIGRWK